MGIDRRDFLKVATAGAGLAITGSSPEEAQASEARRADAVDRAREEYVSATRAVASAEAALDAALSAETAAVEARRLVRRRFEEGLATASDLLTADARAASMTLRAVDARAAVDIAYARRAFAAGGLTTERNDR